MVKRPDAIGIFEFIALSRLRALQLMQGCAPRVEGDHLVAVTAQLEIARGEVKRCAAADVPAE